MSKCIIMIDQKNRTKRHGQLKMAVLKKASWLDRFFSLSLMAIEPVTPIHKRGSW